MSVLQAACVMKDKLVEVLIITYTFAGHQQWKWHTHAHTHTHTYTQRKPYKNSTPPAKSHKFSHSLRRAASLKYSLK